MRARIIGAGLALAGLAAAMPAGAEEERPLGAREFEARCAVCHGADARGQGPYAMFLKTAPGDLTTLAAENGGEFPFERVYRIIDGRTEIVAHGPREMPVWGYEYNEEAQRYYRGLLGPVQAETYVTGRILALIRHLEQVQEP